MVLEYERKFVYIYVGERRRLPLMPSGQISLRTYQCKITNHADHAGNHAL